ncbi:MAG: hypothetical protein GKC10_04485 [Methanosarcinales archaeon]|nr:hypothetical protein [Methanosarcinales archaeon]
MKAADIFKEGDEGVKRAYWLLLIAILFALILRHPHVEGSGDPGSHYSLLPLALASDAGDGHPEGCLIVVPRDYPTIQEAVQASCSGGVVEVHSGVYYENVRVDRQITLRGVDSGQGLPVIDAMDWVSAVTLLYDGINLENFVMTNSGLGSGVEVRSHCNVIKNNTVTGNSLNGMKFKGRVIGNVVAWNEIYQNGFSGIVFEDGAEDNLVAENEIKENGFEGIAFAGAATGNQVLGNTISYNGFDGILFRGRAMNNVVAGNTAFNNSFGGIDLIGNASYNLFADNRLINNSFTGLSLSNLTSENLLLANLFIQNLENNAYDTGIKNHWDNGCFGNFYSDFPCEDKNGDGICDSPCYIPGGMGKDGAPLATFVSVFRPEDIAL